MDKTMDITIERAVQSDIDALARLYDDLNDHLAAGVNHPGWIKGVYPTRSNAERGVGDRMLYVARAKNGIAGTMILGHEPEPAYLGAAWGIDAAYSEVFVITTFAVHPAFLGRGVGSRLLAFAAEHGRQQGIKALRLDVFERNLPAISLYEKNGFGYVGTVDLGLGAYGLDRFKLYERLLMPSYG